MRRSALTLLLFMPMTVQANGAMGLGLEMFDFGYWLVYVAIIVVFEAWWIGRWAELSWIQALSVSLLANAITGICCTSMASAVLHLTFVGGALNPNPFWNAVVLFLVFGIVSGFIEFGIWGLMCKQRAMMARTLSAHILGVPLSLAILLIPDQPYKGLDIMTGYQRRRALETWARHSLSETILEHKRVPSFASVEEAINATRSPDDPSDLWAAAYVPKFNRFSFGENRVTPLEWNKALEGKKIGGEVNNWIWLIRPPKNTRAFERWIELNLLTGETRGRTIDK